jgi:hypothetical protein
MATGSRCAALDVEDDRRAGVALQDVAREQHDLPVGVDDVAVRVTTPRRSPSPSKARPSSASVACTTLIRSARFSGLLGSGWWFGKSPSTSAVEVDHLAAERAQDGRRAGAGDAVAGVDDDLHRPRQPAVAGDAVAVLGHDVHRALRPGRGVVLGLDAPAQALDVLAVDGAAGQHHLEAVVVLRVVAAGDLDAAAAAVPGARGGHVVQHRRRHGAEVDDVQAR